MQSLLESSEMSDMYEQEYTFENRTIVFGSHHANYMLRRAAWLLRLTWTNFKNYGECLPPLSDGMAKAFFSWWYREACYLVENFPGKVAEMQKVMFWEHTKCPDEFACEHTDLSSFEMEDLG